MVPMNFDNLPLAARAEYLKKNGKLLEVQDFYSYCIYLYAVEDASYEVTTDNSTDQLVSIELVGTENIKDISDQIEPYLDESE